MFFPGPCSFEKRNKQGILGGIKWTYEDRCLRFTLLSLLSIFTYIPCLLPSRHYFSGKHVCHFVRSIIFSITIIVFRLTSRWINRIIKFVTVDYSSKYTTAKGVKTLSIMLSYNIVSVALLFFMLDKKEIAWNHDQLTSGSINPKNNPEEV